MLSVVVVNEHSLMIPSECSFFVLRPFPSKHTLSPTQNRTKRRESNTRSLNVPFIFCSFVFWLDSSSCSHVLLKSVSHESNTFISLNTDISISSLTHHTQSQHLHMSRLSLDCILFLSCNVCFCILCLCLLMLIDLVIDLLLLTHSLLTFKYTLQL